MDAGTTAEREEEKPAVFILEDQDRMLKALRDELAKAMPEVYTFGQTDAEKAWSAIERAEGLGRQLRVAVVDQVLEPIGGAPDREWGIRFLREIKKKRPNVFRVMFSLQTTREELEVVLNEQLIHHFAAKDSYKGEQEFLAALVGKIADLTQGVNVGNVQNPSPDREFEEFMKRWVKSLPQGGDTEIRTLSGRTVPASQLVSDPELREEFRRAYLSSRLNRLVVGKQNGESHEVRGE